MILIIQFLAEILLTVAAVYAIRRPKLKKLTHENFPNVDSNKFSTWKKISLKSTDIFLITEFGGVLLGITINSQSARGYDLSAFSLLATGAWFTGIIYSAILGSRAKKLKRELGIK